MLTAQTLGRLREALAPARRRRRAPGRPGLPLRAAPARSAAATAARGARCATRAPTRARRGRRGAPPRRAEPRGACSSSASRAPSTPRDGARRGASSERSRHDVALHLVPPAPGAGKWANLNAALAAHPPGGADWLLIVDDDVVLPRGFLDAFLALAERFGLELAQPAHAFASHAAWEVTRRRPGLLARRTRFVEIGPVTALQRRRVRRAAAVPRPARWAGASTRTGARRGRARGWPLGIVDATPIRHLRGRSPPPTRATRRSRRPRRSSTAAPYVTRDEAGETLAEYRR